MPATIRCPLCGHVLFALELPITSSVPARDVSPPDASLLLLVGEAARLVGVSRSAMYVMVASGQVPEVTVGRSLRGRPAEALHPAGSQCVFRSDLNAARSSRVKSSGSCHAAK
jgi:excisionase family DNA binding protein